MPEVNKKILQIFLIFCYRVNAAQTKYERIPYHIISHKNVPYHSYYIEFYDIVPNIQYDVKSCIN